MPADSHPVELSRDEIRFVIERGFQQMRSANKHATSFKDLTKAEGGWDGMIETVLKRFDELKVYRRLPLGHPGSPPPYPGGS